MISDKIKVMRIKYLLILLFLFSPLGFTQSKSGVNSLASRKGVKFVKVKVVIYEKDSLAKILRRFVREDSVITRKEAMVDKTLKSNPQIKNWRKLKAGKTVYIYLDPKFIDMKKMGKFRKAVRKVSKKIKKKIKKKVGKKSVKKWSVFYMASVGQFAQENKDIAKVEFKQNSPLTLGALYTYYPKKGKYTISTSAYFSYLLAASSNLGKDNVEVPLEIGLNSYFQYPFSKASYNLYAGFDFEKFNTFSLAGVEKESDLLFDQNQIGFLTVGYSKGFKIAKRFFLFKGSFSQSVFSSRSVGYADDADTTSYTGSKFMLFLMSKMKKDYFLSTLFKYHMLKGPSDVNVMRVGLGFGYLF